MKFSAPGTLKVGGVFANWDVDKFVSLDVHTGFVRAGFPDLRLKFHASKPPVILITGFLHPDGFDAMKNGAHIS
jgi:hypothetical protein